MQTEQERFHTVAGVFKVLDDKFSPEDNETTLSLQKCKLSRHTDEATEGCMSRLRMNATEYKYIENERKSKEQFISGINDMMTTE